MGLPNLVGSIIDELPLLPDVSGPIPSAFVLYDTGSYDENAPEDQEFIPPLVNLPPTTPNRCDPHSIRLLIPASIAQAATFFETNVVENFCNGLCDAEGPLELPNGADLPCQP